jgi:hypothetical protein
LARRLGGLGGGARGFTSRLAALLICLIVVDLLACLLFRFFLLLGERPFLFYFQYGLYGHRSLCI